MLWAERDIYLRIKGKDATGQAFRSVERGVQSMRRTIVGLGAGIVGGLGLRAMLGEIRESIELFGVQEQAEKQVSAAIRILGDEAATSLQELKKFASGIQAVTTEGDEAVLRLTAMGMTMGRLGGEQLKEATRAAIGLSRAFAIDTVAAMRLVARGAQGDFATLTRYGIKLDATLDPQEKFNELLRIGAKYFALAREEAESATGQLEQYKNRLGDLKEQVGEAFIPVDMWWQGVKQSFAEFVTEALNQAGRLWEGMHRYFPGEAGNFPQLLEEAKRHKAELAKQEAELQKGRAERERRGPMSYAAAMDSRTDEQVKTARRARADYWKNVLKERQDVAELRARSTLDEFDFQRWQARQKASKMTSNIEGRNYLRLELDRIRAEAASADIEAEQEAVRQEDEYRRHRFDRQRMIAAARRRQDERIEAARSTPGLESRLLTWSAGQDEASMRGVRLLEDIAKEAARTNMRNERIEEHTKRMADKLDGLGVR